MFRREVFRVSDPGLHLVWQKDMYFIKPLPSCFNGAGAGEKIDFDRLGPLIRGLFFSYTRLIASELDFDIALEHNVLPKNFGNPGGWAHWQTLVEDYAVHVAAAQVKRKEGGKPDPNICPDECPRRYKFGALRLRRLNWIMWFTRPNAKDHFFHTRHPVNTFWSGYGKYLIIINLNLTVAFTAMQVSLQVGGTPQWLATAYQWAAYLIVAILLVQVPFYAFVSMFWVISQYIGFVFGTRQRAKQPLLVRQGSFYPG